MEPSTTAFTFCFGCSQCCRGSHPLPQYMHLPKSPQSRVPSSFLLLHVVEVGSPSASHFVWLDDITPPAGMIGYLKVNHLKGCLTQTPRIAPLAKVAVDNAETESFVCSCWWSWMLIVESAWRVLLVRGNTFHSKFLSIETLFYPSFYTMLAESDMIAWDSGTKRYFLPRQKCKFKGGPKIPMGAP